MVIASKSSAFFLLPPSLLLTMPAMPFAPSAAADLTLSTSLPKKLLDGSDIPVFGLGVYKLNEPGPVVAAVDQVGYRLIDTAKMYKNVRCALFFLELVLTLTQEDIVGQALKEMKTPREQVYITTKLHKDRYEPAYRP